MQTQDSHLRISSFYREIAKIDSPESLQVVYPITLLRAPKQSLDTSWESAICGSPSSNDRYSLHKLFSKEPIAIRGHHGSARSG